MSTVKVKRPVGRPRIDTPHPIDVHVGSRVRLRRIMLGLSQERLGDAVGLTFQQIQKYERGANRIGASRLFQLSRVLDVPVSFFFDDAPIATDSAGGGGAAMGQANGDSGSGLQSNDPLVAQETADLVDAYYNITDLNLRKRVYDLTKAAGVVGQQAGGTDQKARKD